MLRTTELSLCTVFISYHEPTKEKRKLDHLIKVFNVITYVWKSDFQTQIKCLFRSFSLKIPQGRRFIRVFNCDRSS